MTTRTYGLSGSGMDIDQMVKDLMKARRVSYDKLVQKKTQLEWKKADYNTMYKAISDYRNTVFSTKLSSNWSVKKTSSSSDAIATATANADSVNVSHTLTVSQLADGINITSSAPISQTGSTGKNTLSEHIGVTGKIKLTISDGTTTKSLITDDTDGTYDTTNKSIYDIVSDINKLGLNVKANYDANLDRFFLSTTKTGASNGIDFTGTDAAGRDLLAKLNLNVSYTEIGNVGLESKTSVKVNDPTVNLASSFSGLSGSFTLKVGGQSISINTEDDSLDDFMNKINSLVNASEEPIAEASYDAVTGKFTLKAANAGETLDLSGSDGAAIDFIMNKLNLKLLSQSGKDASFKLDGASLTQSTNDFTIAGVTYSLKGVGGTDAAPVKISVASDTDKAIANVKAFVEAYNTMLSKLNDELKEPRYRDYLPLTQDQRDAMSEDEIKTWETKAKSGTLYNDSILQELTYNMRNSLMSPINGVTGDYRSAASLGITTGAWQEGGKLYLDETKLREAIESDPDILTKIFTSDGDEASKDGLSVRLYDNLKTSMDKIVKEAGISATVDDDTKSNIAKNITSYTKQITDLNSRLQDIEERYYKQFDAMEVALSRMNQQSAWLAQQFKS